MNLRRPHPRFLVDPSPDMSSPERKRIASLESSIRGIRPSRIASEPPPPALAPDRSKHLVLVLAELAVRQAMIGDTVDARRTIGDAAVALADTTDESTIGMASVLVGEALLECDAPHYAQQRFATAIAICAGLGDRRWTVRAKIGLARALVMLDDPLGAEMLRDLRPEAAGNPQGLAQIDESLRKAEELFDPPQAVNAGYGRPVSFFPPPK